MKNFFLLPILSVICASAFSQTSIDALIQKGYQLHDNGKYKEAIDVYKEALKLDPKSSTIKYEMALSYMYAKDYENAVKYSTDVIAMNDRNLLKAYNVKASALDNSSESKEAIDVYKEALKKFNNDYLLYYNWGLTYFRIKKIC